MTMRIGHGYDVHRFGDGSAIVLGGVSIPYRRGFVAHSDGDVLIHSLCDALLGALALGDIGQHFPDTDPAYANIDSRRLLREVMGKLQQRGYALANADITIVAQAPKMAPHIPAMREHMAADLDVGINAVSIKATTTEGLGFCGREEGIGCHSVVLLQQA